MHKPRRSPSQQRTDRATRILAEMVLHGSDPAHAQAANDILKRRRPISPVLRQPVDVDIKVKKEGDEAFSWPRPPRTPSPSSHALKPVAISLMDLSFVLSLVFGGCCSNVYTYEYLLKLESDLGTTLTFSQMVFITLQSLASLLVWERSSYLPFRVPVPKLKPREVPISQWTLQVLVLTLGSLLNNWAYSFQVPLTIQIVFRSAGLPVSMFFGYLFLSKRYSFSQIGTVLLVTLGVMLSTTSGLSWDTSGNSSTTDITQYTTGIIMLAVSLILTGILGLLQERTYTRYGPCWKEGLFYTHALSLPIFVLMKSSVKAGFQALNRASTSLPSEFGHPPADSLLDFVGASFLKLLGLPATTSLAPYTVLFLNLVTQCICVTGVNQLTSRVSSVSTNIVLTTRKAISLCFSVWWFGNGWNAQLGTGAAFVFSGSILYTLVTSRTSAPLKAHSGPPGGERQSRSPTKTAKKLGRENAVKLEANSPERLRTSPDVKGKGKMKLQ